ncbi:hypothetical protein BpHYR1_020842 [Brachionus plicatilis]|uniref:Uncharacterized protein n=1 Tax=Brachionus plicatilis TaxID=10195 RepID=A0A3M7RWL6_BRAPC|nr:hypothetical protein BpHYR1_020842 [Brachionus plicatilis]
MKFLSILTINFEEKPSRNKLNEISYPKRNILSLKKKIHQIEGHLLLILGNFFINLIVNCKKMMEIKVSNLQNGVKGVYEPFENFMSSTVVRETTVLSFHIRRGSSSLKLQRDESGGARQLCD